MVSGSAVVAAAAGAGVGVGVLLVVVAIRGTTRTAPVPGRVRLRPQRVIAAVVAGFIVLALTRWVSAAAALAVLVAVYDRVFGGAARSRASLARLEALAGWTESLRDMVATGVALPEALVASVDAASPVISPQLAVLADRLAAREPVEQALRALADDFDDAGADLTVAALVVNARAQGRALEAVLSALARSARSELSVRRAVVAERRSTRRAVQFVVATTVVTALGLAVFNPGYVAPYRTATGQLVLAVVVGIFTVGFVWLSRLSAMPSPARFLASPRRSR